MKTSLLIIVLLALMPSLIYCQEEAPKENYIHSFDVGIGTGSMFEPSTAVSLGLSNGLGKYIANFIDYNLYFDKSGIQTHEISVKFGPYMRFNQHSYLAVSSGLSFFLYGTASGWRYDKGMFIYRENKTFGIPVQAKLNFDVAN